MVRPCAEASTTFAIAAPRTYSAPFASAAALVLAHLDCDEKSNEIPAVQNLLGSLVLTGSVVTVDVMHCVQDGSVERP
jgi:hypothetical protein